MAAPTTQRIRPLKPRDVVTLSAIERTMRITPAIASTIDIRGILLLITIGLLPSFLRLRGATREGRSWNLLEKDPLIISVAQVASCRQRHQPSSYPSGGITIWALLLVGAAWATGVKAMVQLTAATILLRTIEPW